MSNDLGPILEGWEYEPDDLQVRLVSGRDGREKLQMRLELGLLQMELDGRPDGQRPHGHESLLEYHEAQAADSRTKGYRLTADDCSGLMREGVQYYHRYLSLFQLQRYDLVARDTSRNLRLFAFVSAHAEKARDRFQFDQYRPYVIMMHTRALGLGCIDRGESKKALEWIDRGVRMIREFLEEYDQETQEDQCQELGFLLQWREHVDGQWKRTPREQLEDRLARAVSDEDYEEAARLRDQIKRMRGKRKSRKKTDPPEQQKTDSSEQRGEP